LVILKIYLTSEIKPVRLGLMLELSVKFFLLRGLIKKEKEGI